MSTVASDTVHGKFQLKVLFGPDSQIRFLKWSVLLRASLPSAPRSGCGWKKHTHHDDKKTRGLGWVLVPKMLKWPRSYVTDALFHPPGSYVWCLGPMVVWVVWVTRIIILSTAPPNHAATRLDSKIILFLQNHNWIDFNFLSSLIVSYKN